MSIFDVITVSDYAETPYGDEDPLFVERLGRTRRMRMVCTRCVSSCA